MSNYILIFEAGLNAGSQIPITAENTTLGRSSQCDIPIADPALSRVHCTFELKGAELWIKDHQSANETLVNDLAITETKLNPGDIITAGDSIIRVTVAASDSLASAEPSASTLQPPAQGDVVIDLGFDSPDTASAALHQKNIVRPILWGFTALLIFFTCLWVIFSIGPDKKKGQNQTTTVEKKQPFLIYYEKVDASASNIFRFELSLDSAGLLVVKIDDLAGGNRHIRKEKKIADTDTLANLSHNVMQSGFFSLDKEYSGLPSVPNTLSEHYLVAAIGKKFHSCRLVNRSDEPEAFKTLREKIETFSKNELGIWAIQFSTEKLTELAQNAFDVAKKQYAERDVKLGNRYEAIRNYQESLFYLDTVNPKPTFYDQIQQELEAAKEDLKKQLQEQNFRADRAINLADWPTAARELKIICELLPDRTDEVHKTAARKLLDVETRIKKR
jgi:pSer/pThr/pTyr-binding forkhead associated (FHA) protein